MGDPYWLFRLALIPIGYLSSIYVVWPASILATLVLIYFRFHPNAAYLVPLKVTWWVLIGIGIVLVVSLAIAYFARPENDRELAGFYYVALVAAAPVVVSAGVAAFFKPS